MKKDFDYWTTIKIRYNKMKFALKRAANGFVAWKIVVFSEYPGFREVDMLKPYQIMPAKNIFDNSKLDCRDLEG